MISKQLTDRTILLTSDTGTHVALVFERDGVYVSTHNKDVGYQSLETIAEEFNEPLVKSSVTHEVKSTKEIMGYPIKHDIGIDAKLIDGKPTYRTKFDSKVVYAAGWWIIPFDGGMRVSQSPKLSTIVTGSFGPYKDKFFANSIMASINR